MNVLNVAVSALLGAATVASFVKAVRADRRARLRGESRLTLEVMDRYREATRLIGEADFVERTAREASDYLRTGYAADGTAPKPMRWSPDPAVGDDPPKPAPPACVKPDIGRIQAGRIDASKIRADVIRPERIYVDPDAAIRAARDAFLAQQHYGLIILPPDHPDYTTPGDPT